MNSLVTLEPPEQLNITFLTYLKLICGHFKIIDADQVNDSPKPGASKYSKRKVSDSNIPTLVQIMQTQGKKDIVLVILQY